MQTVIIGGGIVGLATAYSLQQRDPGRRVTVIEKEAEVAAHQTGHNSGVLHSGLYYAPGSMKARMAVEGLGQMVKFCEHHAIPHEICGKIVVAVDPAELPRLDELGRRGAANGIPGLEMLEPPEFRAIEPHAGGIRALRVPTTGIVDFPAVSHKLRDLVREGGGEVRTGCRMLSARRSDGSWRIETTTGGMSADFLINCAGLHCDRVATAAGASPEVRIIPFRGEYYKLRPDRQGLVRHLIYPVPDPAFPFLGVHFTRMIHGGVEAGPNAVLALKREGYRKTDFDVRDTLDALGHAGFRKLAARHWRMGWDETVRSWNKPAFVRALQRLLPDLREPDLEPGGAGVRAQALDGRGNLVSDFAILPGDHALHVLNAPSPAATASLAIGDHIAGLAAAA
jgi:L-2-hydroxyglutarate oxidase